MSFTTFTHDGETFPAPEIDGATFEYAPPSHACMGHTFIARFPSLRHFYAPLPDITNHDAKGEGGARDGWTFGADGRVKAIQALRSATAPPEALAYLDKCRGEIGERLDSDPALRDITARRRRTMRDEGDEIDVDRYLAQRDDCFAQSCKGRPGRLVTLAWGSCVSCGESADAFQRLAAVCAAAAEALERRGFATRVVACSVAQVLKPHWWLDGDPLTTAAARAVSGKRVRSGDDWPIHSIAPKRYTTTAPVFFGDLVTLREPGQPLDLAALCSTGAPGFLRWASFWSSYRIARGLGRPEIPHYANRLAHPVSESQQKALGIDALVGADWTRNTERVVSVLRGLMLGAEDERDAA